MEAQRGSHRIILQTHPEDEWRSNNGLNVTHKTDIHNCSHTAWLKQPAHLCQYTWTPPHTLRRISLKVTTSLCPT